MKRPLIVGLTGGIGSGKSLALETLRRQGAEVLDLDALARQQARKGAPVFKKIVRAFGKDILAANGELDRKKLAAVVFKSPALRRKLERMTHPPILKELVRRKKQARGVLVVDVPLLFERGHQALFDATLVVSAPLSVRLARVAKRDAATRAQALARAKAQLTDARREALADVVVRNDGGRRAFVEKISEYGDAFRLLQQGEQTVPPGAR